MSKSKPKAGGANPFGGVLDAAGKQVKVDQARKGRRGTARLLVSEIKDRPGGDTRKIAPLHVLGVAASISAVGLLEPIVLDKANRLVAGLHRREACRLLLMDPDKRRSEWLKLMKANGLEAEEKEVDLLISLEAPEGLAKGVPVHVMPTLDWKSDPDACLAAEAAENTARRKYTPEERRALVDRLLAAGYVKGSGRPRRGEKALRPAIQNILGVSRNTARAIMKQAAETDAPKRKADQVAAARTRSEAARRRLAKDAGDFKETLAELLELSGGRAPNARKLAALATQIEDLADAAQSEIEKL